MEGFAQQTAPVEKWEFIVVDNNSSDGTRETVELFNRRFTNFRYAFEGEQGLSHARNRGWREALGNYVGYVDDDCRIPQEWVSNALSVIDHRAPDAFGGPIPLGINRHHRNG